MLYIQDVFCRVPDPVHRYSSPLDSSPPDIINHTAHRSWQLLQNYALGLSKALNCGIALVFLRKETPPLVPLAYDLSRNNPSVDPEKSNPKQSENVGKMLKTLPELEREKKILLQ